jgi:hypothetical protein
MRRHRFLVPLTASLALLLLGSSLLWATPPAAVAQSTTCVVQQTPTVSTVATTAATSAANLRLTPQQKQALCQAAENLERQNLGLSRDLSSALLPGTLGPTGPLAFTDVAAHTSSPELGARFDVTLAAATSGLAGSIMLSSALAGYLRALVDDSTDSNFTEVPQPSPPPFVFPSIGPDTNPPVAVTFRTLLVNESQTVGVLQTLLASLRRARGAAAAGNTALQAQQLRAAGLSAAQLATLLAREPLLRADVQGAMAATEGLPTFMGDPALVASLQGAAQAMAQFALSQGASLPAPAPPLPATVPVVLPPPPPPPSPPAQQASTSGQ